MSLLSISLDLVGSTEMKDQLSKFAREHNTNLEKLYIDLANKMLLSMNSFMKQIDLDQVLEIKRLFLVKRIGDEYWYVYDLKDLDPLEITRHSTHMVQALLAFFSSSPFDVTAIFPEESDDPYAYLVMPVAAMRKGIYWKSTIDLISHAIDLSKLAEDKLDQFLSGLTSSGKEKGFATVGDEELLELKNRLSVGFSYTKPDKVVDALRSDYIGVEVDRFFRISKFAKTGMILVGESFLKLLMPDKIPVYGKCSFRDPISAGIFTTFLSGVSVELINFTKCELKGISEKYSGAFIYYASSSAMFPLNRIRRCCAVYIQYVKNKFRK